MEFRRFLASQAAFRRSRTPKCGALIWPNLQEIGSELANPIGKEIGSDLANPIGKSAPIWIPESRKEIGSNLDTGILQGNRLQFGYRNPARKSAPICHPTGNVLIFWELRNLTYTGIPDAWKFSKVILNGYFTFQVFRQLEY
ncbi:unnamed protein product [Rhizophagus irregularis]|nr:unnamed protein product [Rhizophagus irregularis]